MSRRPLLLALLLGLAAQLLFTIGLDRPTNLVFDEVHYVPAARTMLALAEPANTEHPPLGKAIIAVGIAAFGDNPVGWRAMATLAGTATVIGGFAILMLVFGQARIALLGAYLVAINQTVFIQARIGMLDGFLGAFVTSAIAATLWAMRAGGSARLARLALAGALFGGAVAVKWAAAPYVALACLAVLAWGWRQAPRAPALAAPIVLGLVAIVVYFASFAPAFLYARDAITLADLIPLQRKMYESQTVLLNPHPYQSDWWSWPLMLRPIWYYYERDQGTMRGILLVGNPAVYWGGLVAVAACGWAGLRGSARHALLAGLWLFSIGIYVLIPKSLGFFYYYHLSGIFLALAIPPALAMAKRRDADLWYAAAATILFVYFYPIISGAPLTDEQAFNHWMWFSSWR